MATIKIPYGKRFLEAEIPDRNLSAVLMSKAHEYHPEESQEEIVSKALDHPIGSPALEQLVTGRKNMVLITSDHTRPVPSRITLPILLDRIRRANPDIDVTILIATGFHRPTTREEMLDKFGREIVEREKIVNHISEDYANMVHAGTLPSGGELLLNRLVMEAELVISEGFIEPHFFAGFSGGRKSILPGVAAARTVMANHCSEFIASEYARTGILRDNPIHRDMLYAAKQAGLAFILNVVIDGNKKIIRAFAGDSELAHAEGCRFVTQLCSVDAAEADIVVTSNGGFPLDQNIYQSVKGMTAAETCCREGGVIVMVSACNDGHGGQSFYEHMARAKCPEEILEKALKTGRNDTPPDQWEYQILARILSRRTVILVSGLCDAEMIKAMHMKHALTLEQALDMAFEMMGKDAAVTVIPDGVSVVVTRLQ